MALARFKDLCLDATDPVLVGTFWAAALGLTLEVQDGGDTVARGATPAHTIWVNAVPEPRTTKTRVHLDVNTPSVQDLVDLGATVVDADTHRWTLMTDPEGTEFCAFVRAEPVTQPIYEIGIDAGPSMEAAHRIAAWWAAVLGAEVVDHDGRYSSVEPVPGAPFSSLDFAPVPEPKTAKNRVHLDVTTGDLDGLVAAGAGILLPHSPERPWTVLADPDGNEFCAFPEDSAR